MIWQIVIIGKLSNNNLSKTVRIIDVNWDKSWLIMDNFGMRCYNSTKGPNKYELLN